MFGCIKHTHHASLTPARLYAFSPTLCRDVRTSWTRWPSLWWTSGPASSCASRRDGTRMAITSRSPYIMRDALWTSPPPIGTRANMEPCLGWPWRQASTGSTMSPRPISTAQWKQVRVKAISQQNPTHVSAQTLTKAICTPTQQLYIHLAGSWSFLSFSQRYCLCFLHMQRTFVDILIITMVEVGV